MASGRYGAAMGQVGRLFGPTGTASALGESSLLDRFARTRDEAAFEALIARHGPMVLGVCRAPWTRPDDVEDAFQATFLVLARRAGSIRDGDRLGPWLHGVARRVTARARARSLILRSRERPSPIEPPAPAEAGCPVEADELRAALDDELGRLPEKYRVPLVLCYLEGLTHDEAASRLGWPVGTVRSRLAGGRDRLRTRLARLGLSPSAGLATVLPMAPISEALISTTAQFATAAGSSIPAQVATLATGASIVMKWGSLKAISPAFVLAAGLVLGGAGVVAWRAGSGGPDASPSADAIKRELDDTRARVHALEQAQANPSGRVAWTGGGPEDSTPRMMGGPGEGAAPQPGEGGRAGGMMGAGMGGGGMGMMMGGGERSPNVEQIDRGNNPPLLMVRSASRDRVTMIDTATQKKATFRLPKDAVTEMTPIIGDGVLTFQMKGPAITRAAVFDFKEFSWAEHDLKEAVTSLSATPAPGSPLIAFAPEGTKITRITVYDRASKAWSDHDLKEPIDGRIQATVVADTARYEQGRFLYVYSGQAKKWSVLEREHSPGMMGMGMMGGMTGSSSMIGPTGGTTGAITVADEDVIHIYDPKTGDWTHISTKEDQ